MPSAFRLPSVLCFVLLAGLVFGACQRKSKTPVTSPPPVSPPPPLSYTYEIRPILANKCFPCHGRDGRRNRSGLRLDHPSFAFDPLGDDPHYHALVPGDREHSEVWRRVTSKHSASEQTSPPHHELLNPEERELIGRWIDQGAAYQPHWAFTPLRKEIPVPPVRDRSWIRNEIDHFILASLQREAIAPAPETAPSNLLRRTALALTGLPPSLDELKTFDPAGFESTVDRLLDSPSFGEHLASLWLEIARYADTVGSHSQDAITRWPYRSWVVNAFNRNMPFDRFLTAQLAGDLEADRAHVLASAFNRLHPLPDLSVDSGLARSRNAAARADNFGTSILGISLRCARCHDHKSDPLSTDDFRAVAAFFGAIGENGLSRDPSITPAPTQALPTADQEQALLEARQEVAAVQQQLRQTIASQETDFQNWLATSPIIPVIHDAIGIFTFDGREQTIANRALNGSVNGLAPGLKFVPGFGGAAVQFTGESGVSFPELISTRRWDRWSFTLRLRSDALQPRPMVLLSRGHGPLDGLRGLDLLLDDGHLVARLSRDWPSNAIAVRTDQPAVPPKRWTLVTWTYDGSNTTDGMKLYVDGRKVATSPLANRLWKRALPLDEPPPLQLGWRQGTPGFANGAIDDFQAHSRPLAPLEVAHLYDGRALSVALSSSAQHLPALRSYYFSSINSKTRILATTLSTVRRERALLEDAVLEVPVMAAYFSLGRESFETPPQEQEPRSGPTLPALLSPPPADAPRTDTPLTRLDLASALTHPDHPLTARVFVNRLWSLFFGRGLVATTGDFGLNGAPPSHPELLDWLARDFVASGWDVKHLCKTIALSATFRQDSVRPETSSGLPLDHLFARGPSFALSPSRHRDFVLGIAGLLETSTERPPFRTDGPPYRRSLYALRSHPASPVLRPSSGDRESCAIDYTRPPPEPEGPTLAERDLLVASRTIASRLIEKEPDPTKRLADLLLLLNGKLPSDEDFKALVSWAEDQRAQSTADSPQLIQPGQRPDTDRLELAAWTKMIHTLIGERSFLR